MPQISVIVPVYKAEAFLEKCIRSILDQTFRDLELILVDDGSPDCSPALCDRFAEKDVRVHTIHQKNAGVAAARNRGLEVASGEYVTFVDSDDYIDLRMYESMMRNARQYNCDVVMCDCVKEFGSHNEIYTHGIRPGFYDRKQLEEEYFPHLLIMPNVEYPATISNWLCLFRNRENLRYEVGIRYSEDLLFGSRMMYFARSFYYMKGEALYHYNCTNQFSATHTFVPNKWDDYKKLHRSICRDFGTCQGFDFSKQIDKVLLFFVYNAMADVLRTDALDEAKRRELAEYILRDDAVRRMFDRIKIAELPISSKLKLQTACYKHRLGLELLSRYLRRK